MKIIVVSPFDRIQSTEREALYQVHKKLVGVEFVQKIFSPGELADYIGRRKDDFVYVVTNNESYQKAGRKDYMFGIIRYEGETLVSVSHIFCNEAEVEIEGFPMKAVDCWEEVVWRATDKNLVGLKELN
ncbi:MAG: hypothetical protein KGH93_02555 [Patescibacteria group bacterium]|nr:hypothetical protein [Patescibacteria group bacterium]MDE1946056.1 hypothetical protein [Patescibacteria group bacterium]